VRVCYSDNNRCIDDCNAIIVNFNVLRVNGARKE